MKIVINIPEEMYMDIKEEVRTKVNTFEHIPFLHEVISVGTPLPKGYGRLIDADAFIARMEDASKRQQYKKLLIDDYLTVDDVFKAIIESLQNKGLANGDAPTIIEADTESDAPNFESVEYVEERIENYNKLLKSGILDCVTEKSQESEDEE